jgi:acetyl esterase/lipase
MPCGLVESIPIASVGAIRVITVDYREGPEYSFPAASEDLAAVYAALLKTYKPRNIGIYGCSAGGILTAQSVAWIGSHGMPSPGASSHALLVQANVEADLHVYEGMWHAFFIYPELPESAAAYSVIVRFFDEHLGS